jgi:hypothetical protein
MTLMNNSKITEVYVSVDIEADGPYPGDYSMTALGASIAGYRTDDETIHKLTPTNIENQFYTEIKPISDNFILQALKVGVYKKFTKTQVDADPTGETIRDYLYQNGEYPAAALTRFTQWIDHQKARFGTNHIVFAAYPLGFDWLFTYWYMMKYSATGSPFGHSKHIDIKTLYATKYGKPISKSVKTRMPKRLHSKHPHTHLAIDDAIEQGELLINILKDTPPN